MTVTRFSGTTLPPGWTAVEPALGHIIVRGGYLRVQSDAGADFDNLSGGVSSPQGPYAWVAAGADFDYAVGLGNAANAAENQSFELTSWDPGLTQGIRFSQFISEVSGRDPGWFARRQTSVTQNITLTAPPSELYGPRLWMRVTRDSATDTWTLRTSHTGKPGTWHTHATLVDAFVPTQFLLGMTAAVPDANGREMRYAVFVDMAGRADDATTPPGDTATAQLNDFDLSDVALPAGLTSQVNAGGTVNVGGGFAQLGTDTDVLDSFAWLIGPDDLPPDHGMLIRYRFPQPSVQNSFAAPIVRGAGTTDLPGAQVLQDKYRPGTGLVTEVNGAGSFGDIVRILTANPTAIGETFDGNEFYGFANMIDDLDVAVDGSTGQWIWLRFENIDAYWRARLWFDGDPEPATWAYEGEQWAHFGTEWFLSWSHNDSTVGGGGGVALMDVAELELYVVAEGESVLVFDSFNRADAAVLGNADTGQPWLFENWGISDDTARRGSPGNVNATIAANITGDHAAEVTAILETYTTGDQLFGVITRAADDSNFILWERVLTASEDAIKLYVQVAGNFVQRDIFGGGPGATGLVPTDPLTLRIEQAGANLTCYANGVPVANHTLTGPEQAALGTRAGMRNEGVLPTVWFNDFSVVSLSAATGAPPVTGTADLTAPPSQLAVAGSAVAAGTGALVPPAAVLVSAGAPAVTGSAALTAGASWITAFGSEPISGTAALTAPAGRLAAGEEAIVGAATDAPCNVWEPTWCIDASTLSPGVIAATGMALEVATDLLWTLSGRRYGSCTFTSRPCAEDCAGVIPFGWQRLIPDWGGGTGWPWPALIGGKWFNLGCGMCQNTCSCSVLEQFEVPYPVASIQQIKVDGQVLPPSSYRVDDHRYVVRLDGEPWPRCNDLNLPDTSPGTWSITATYGVEVPPSGRLAVGELAIEIAKYCAGDEGCKISTRVQQVQRQGVTKVFVDPNKWREQGLTGLLWVDQFLAAKNPTRAIARAKIFDIDGRRARVTGTGG